MAELECARLCVDGDVFVVEKGADRRQQYAVLIYLEIAQAVAAGRQHDRVMMPLPVVCAGQRLEGDRTGPDVGL